MRDFKVPIQNIPESKKDKDWLKDNIDYLISLSRTNNRYLERDNYCFNKFTGKESSEYFKYLTDERDDAAMPVKFKNIKLTAEIIKSLLGEELNRVRKYSVVVSDEESIKRKHQENTLKFNQEILSQLVESVSSQMDNPSFNHDIFNDNNIKKIERKIKKNKLNQEIQCQKLAEEYEKKHNLKAINNKIALYTHITGKAFYRTYIPYVGANPVIESIDPRYIAFDGSYKIDEIAKSCRWVVQTVYMTKEQILNSFGHMISDDKKECLEKNRGFFSDNNIIYNGDSNDVDSHGIPHSTYGGVRESNVHPVYFGEWKSERTINLMEFQNPHNDDVPFLKFYSDDHLATIPANKKKKAKVKSKKIIEDLYEFIRVGDDIYLHMGKSRYQRRDKENPSRVNLSYNGMILDAGDGTPYSSVWNTKDLDDLYKVLHFHKERLIATSGVRGTVYDLGSQPDGMELSEVLYYKKLGLLLIQGDKLKSFNQFSSYDDTLSASIEVILQMIEYVRSEAERALGVSKTRLGEVNQRDISGTVKQSIKQSYNATEGIFYFHDMIYLNMIRDLVNLAKEAWAKDSNIEEKLVSYTTSNGDQVIENLNIDLLNSDYRFYFTDSIDVTEKLNELKTFSAQLIQSGGIDAKSYLNILASSNASEIDEILDITIEEQQKKVEEMSKMQAESDSMKSKAEFEYKLQLEQFKLKSMREIKDLELQIENKKIETERELKTRELQDKNNHNKAIIEVKKSQLEVEEKELDAALKQGKIKNLGNRREVKNI